MCLKISLILIVNVILISIVSFVETNELTPSIQGIRRLKRQDAWVWETIDQTATTESKNVRRSEKQTNAKEEQEEVNPCKKPEAVMPNFSRPGLRISEEKCYEYLWKVHNQEEKERNSEECIRYLKAHNISFSGGAIGGRDAISGEFPHMGNIGWRAVVGGWVYKCGGSLVSTKFVLTAAHCSKASNRDTTVAELVPTKVRFGDQTYGFQGTAGENILKIIVHPQYQSPKKYYDIALIEMEQDIPFFKLIHPACLWTKPDTKTLGTEATSTGWGVTKIGGETSPILQVVELSIIDTEKCDELLEPHHNRNWWSVADTQICAGNLTGGVDTCQGDSGGPLQVKIPLPETSKEHIHYLIGVTSFGISCARSNTPGLYTRVSAFVDWIENIVWK